MAKISKLKGISDATKHEIVRRLITEIFPKLRQRGLTVFLVGAGKNAPSSIRDSIRKELTSRSYLKRLDVYYPEELFEELLRSGTKYDLLSLENLLAKSVHSVVIILEGPGAVAELGAFANHKGLKDRLIVIVDKKYRRANSFIMLGPVRFLCENTQSAILYHDFRNPKFKELCPQIRSLVRNQSDKTHIDYSVANPIYAQYFIVSIIYLMEPVESRTLREMMGLAGIRSTKKVEAIVTCSLNILKRQKEVEKKDGKWLLSKAGLERLRGAVSLAREGRRIQKLFDDFRISILNERLRR